MTEKTTAKTFKAAAEAPTATPAEQIYAAFVESAEQMLKASSDAALKAYDTAVSATREPALTAINERLRDDYIVDCQRGVDRWNKLIADAGIDFTIKLPHRAFHRAIGQFANAPVTPEGRVIDAATFAARQDEWLPNDSDHEYVKSLMEQVIEPGRYARWIAPPRLGINNQPIDFPYVRM